MKTTVTAGDRRLRLEHCAAQFMPAQLVAMQLLSSRQSVSMPTIN